MRKKILLLVLLSIFIISWLNLILIFNYLDPYRNETISFLSFLTMFFLFVTSFFSIILYIIKKVYYRWEVFLSHILSSLRQAILITILIISIWVFFSLWVLSYSTILLSFFILILLELLFQNI